MPVPSLVFGVMMTKANLKSLCYLCALYFSPCILSLCLQLSTHTIIHYSFADDLQLQMSAPSDEISGLLHSMQSCISDVKAWATADMLKLNDNKT